MSDTKTKGLSNILIDLVVFLKRSVNNVECHSVGFKYTRSQNFNLKELGGGKGVRNFSIRNTGNHDITLLDANETVVPGASFTISSPHRITNEQFEVRMDEQNTGFAGTDSKREFVVRYLVDKC